MTSFIKLPEGIMKYILNYLNIIDISNLLKTSKKFKYLLENDKQIWAKQLIRYFFLQNNKESINFEPLTIINEDQLNFRLFEDAQHIWSAFCNIQNRWKEILTSFIGCEKASNFVRAFWNNLQDPSIPLPMLKRDIHSFSTQTRFQNFLTEVFFGIDAEPNFFDFNQENVIRESLEKVMETDKNNIVNFSQKKFQIFEVRWYKMAEDLSLKIEDTRTVTKKVSQSKKISRPSISRNMSLPEKNKSFKLSRMNSTYISGKKNKKKQSCLNSNTQQKPTTRTIFTILDIEESFFRSIKIHCRMINRFLQSIDHPVKLLKEYNQRWNHYVMSIMDMQKDFKFLETAINSLYSQYYKDEFINPKFTIWRLMVKVWLKEIFNPLKDSLTQSFRKLSKEYRLNENDLIKDALNTSVTNIPLSLTNMIRNDQGSQTICYDLYDNASEILDKYIKSIQDLSINEFEVFWIENHLHNNLSPYNEILMIFDEDSEQLYESFWNKYNEYPIFFERFFESDKKLFMKIGDQKVLYNILNIQKKKLSQLIKNNFIEKAERFIYNINQSQIDVSHYACEEILIVLQDFEEIFDVDEHRLLGEIFKFEKQQNMLTYLLRQDQILNNQLKLLKKSNAELKHIEQNNINYCYLLNNRGIFLDVNPNLLNILDIHKEVDYKQIQDINESIKGFVLLSNQQEFEVFE